MVAPLRGRGSKPPDRDRPRADAEVAPLRGRGSKLVAQRDAFVALDCRPLTGAWVETCSAPCLGRRHTVAPLRGRGSKPLIDLYQMMVDPSPPYGGVGRNDNEVPPEWRADRRPLTGAWVETAPAIGSPKGWVVAPLRGRGSKLRHRQACRDGAASRPLTGAWVETVWDLGASADGGGRPLTGAWVETEATATGISSTMGRPLTGA